MPVIWKTNHYYDIVTYGFNSVAYTSWTQICYKRCNCLYFKKTWHCTVAKTYNGTTAWYKLLKTNAAIWFNKTCRNDQLPPKCVYIKTSKLPVKMVLIPCIATLQGWIFFFINKFANWNTKSVSGIKWQRLLLCEIVATAILVSHNMA
jgi:hypothetical protein